MTSPRFARERCSCQGTATHYIRSNGPWLLAETLQSLLLALASAGKSFREAGDVDRWAFLFLSNHPGAPEQLTRLSAGGNDLAASPPMT